MAEVLAQAWGIPIPAAVIWPECRDGQPPAPAHLQPWVAQRTVHDLAVFARADLLNRREVLAASIGVACGPAFMDPLGRWLVSEPVRLPGRDAAGPGRVGLSMVEEIERATARFAAVAADLGGGACREAAVGQLKYGVDLLEEGGYGPAVGNRLLAAVARLAGEVGHMCHDVGMDGPAQKYLVHALQAAGESTDERAPLVAVVVLADMAEQMRLLGHPDSGLHLVEAALGQVPADPHRFGDARAMLWSLKGRLLAATGTSRLAEVNGAIDMSLNLLAESAGEDTPAWQPFVLMEVTEADLYRRAAGAWLDLAAARPAMGKELAARAQAAGQKAVAGWPDGFRCGLADGYAQLAHARFLLGEPEHACRDGEQALQIAAVATGSARLAARLRDLWAASEPYHHLRRVHRLRERLRAATVTGPTAHGRLGQPTATADGSQATARGQAVTPSRRSGSGSRSAARLPRRR
ncbi:MAG: hypothetical protein IRZ05_18180 [Micromonosporaceae bacterium]|nr:hypothetical protein [Micromonosporaceae bacterium]